MKMLFFLLILSQLGVAEERLSIVTINIRFDGESFGLSDGDDDWKFRKAYLAERLLKTKPAVIGTQEGLEKQLRELHALLANHTLVENHRTWRNEFYPSLFINTDEVSLLESGDLWLSDTPEIAGSRLEGSQWPRLYTWALIDLKTCPLPTKVLFANVHLDNEFEDVRYEQTRILAESLKRQLQKYPETKLVLMGDFNSGPKSLVRQILQKHLQDLKDPWEELGLSEKSSYNGFNNKHFDAGSIERIDWILLHGPFRSPWIHIDDTHRLHPHTGKPQFPSDHHPVHLEVSACQ